MIYATGGLVDGLLSLAADRDPGPVSIALAVSPAGEFGPDAGLPADLPPDAPIFTDFYLPDAGESVTAVFGVDLSTPGSQGRFVSHPDGDPSLSRTDDLHEVVFVAIPPWTRDSLRAYDRRGRRQQVTVLDVVPPERSLPDYSR